MRVDGGLEAVECTEGRSAWGGGEKRDESEDERVVENGPAELNGPRFSY